MLACVMFYVAMQNQALHVWSCSSFCENNKRNRYCQEFAWEHNQGKTYPRWIWFGFGVASAVNQTPQPTHVSRNCVPCDAHRSCHMFCWSRCGVAPCLQFPMGSVEECSNQIVEFFLPRTVRPHEASYMQSGLQRLGHACGSWIWGCMQESLKESEADEGQHRKLLVTS